MILSPTLSLLAITYVASGTTFTEYVTLLPFHQSPVLWGMLKFSVVFPFAYHSFNGLRHLVCYSQYCSVVEMVCVFNPFNTGLILRKKNDLQ